MIELFKTVKNYRDYKVSNLGKVISLKRKKPYFMSLVDYRGYQRVELFNNGIGKLISVHRLVAEAFINNQNNKETVNHINGIKNDNRVKNLEWCTRSENDLHAFSIGLRTANKGGTGRFGKLHQNSKPVDQMDIHGKFIKTFDCLSEAERETGVFKSNIGKVCLHKRNHAGGFLWKFNNGQN